MIAAALAFGQEPAGVQLSHLYTLGSKHGIHPPRILNRRAVTAALGLGEPPYGLGFPVGVATDLHGRVWITDGATASVHVFDRATGAYSEIRRVGELLLRQPSGIAADAQGRIYVVDSALASVFVFDENGEYDRTLVKRSERLLEGPTAIAVSEEGRTIYVADPPRNAVVALNREGEVNTIIQLPSELSEPSAISVASNQVYVMGARQHRVQIFSPDGRPRGEMGWNGVHLPSAFTYDAARQWFLVANPRLVVVQIFDAEGRNVGVFGQQGEGVDQMQQVNAMHVDAKGLIYLVDSHRGKVLVFGDSSHPAAP